MYAVIRTGGKQYRVSEGTVLRVEKLNAEPGAAIEFNEVLLVGKADSVEVGSPLVPDGTVTGTVLGHGKGDKVRVIKFKRRKNYLRHKGHRQLYTEVRINQIGAAKKTARKKAKATVKPKAEAVAEQEG